MNQILAYIVLISLLWGGWPLVTRWTGIAQPSPIDTLIISASAFVPVLLAAIAASVLNGTAAAPPAGALTKYITAGFMMGFGLLFYNRVMSSPLIDISASIPVINSGMLIVTVAGGIWFFSEPLTLQRCLGFGAILVGIYLLRPPAVASM